MEAPTVSPPTSLAVETARSLWVIYRQLPHDAQTEFKRLMDEEDDDAGWMRITEKTLRDDWEAPENDVWDKLYAEQHG